MQNVACHTLQSDKYYRFVGFSVDGNRLLYEIQFSKKKTHNKNNTHCQCSISLSALVLLFFF